MKGVYNKEALNRIASQDRLDRMIVLVNPSIWIAIVTAFVIIGALAIWLLGGELPTSVDASGMFMNEGGINHLYSEQEGFVTDVYVDVGDTIEAGDVIASLGTEDDVFQVRQIDTRIQYVENMTFDSELDEVTSDTEQMAQIKMDAKTADTTSRKTDASLELKKEKLNDQAAVVKEKEDLMLSYKEKYFATLNITDQKEQLAYQEADEDYSKHYSLYESYKSTYISAQENYNTKKADFDAKYASFDTTTASQSELDSYNSALADVEAARTQAGDAKYFMEQEESKVKEANTALDSARKSYLEYLNSTSGTAASNTIASTEYSEALQDYETAKSEYKSLLSDIDTLELQSVLDEDDAELNYEKYRQQFDNQKSIVLHDLERQRDSLLHQTDNKTITAVTSGEVYDVCIEVGSAVTQGSEIVKLLSGDLNQNCVVCYVPIANAKKLRAGMEAHVYPSSVDKEEYGHIIGEVTGVKDHVASNADMLDQLGDQSLVNQFTTEGSVQEVTVLLDPDPTTKSGYKWNSQKGSDVTLTTGTMVTITFITENKRPLDVLIPYIKKKLSFENSTDSTGKSMTTNEQ